MPIDPAACGVMGEPVERAWTSTDCILYALAVGAGREDPSAELAFTTENTLDVPQQVLPTFGATLGRPTPDVLERIGTFDPAMLVQAGQTVALHRPIPVAGSLRATSTLASVEDKGSGALVTITTDSVETSTGEPLLTTTTSLFVRGEGGFGGKRTRTRRHAPPERVPDHVVTDATLPGQALLYRLVGDRNPLHSDPAFAAGGGLRRADPARTVRVRLHRPRAPPAPVRRRRRARLPHRGSLQPTDRARRHALGVDLGRRRRSVRGLHHDDTARHDRHLRRSLACTSVRIPTARRRLA